MARPRIPLESFDLATGWPIQTFASYTEAAAAGFKRANIDSVIQRRRREHGGRGWRRADYTSRLAEFVQSQCSERPELDPVQCVTLDTFIEAYQAWQTRPGSGYYSMMVCRLAKRFKFWYVDPGGGAHQYQTLQGLVLN